MKPLVHLALLHILIIADHFRLITANTSQANITVRHQWGSMETYLKTKNIVTHLEEDVYKPGNILFSDQTTLMTTNGNSTDLIVGFDYGYAEGKSSKAKFRYITGFLQTNSSHVLLVDQGSHCLRFVNRITNISSLFVGSCTSYGFSDGHFKNSSFKGPWCIIKDINNPEVALVTDLGNRALRSINLATGEVRTLAKALPAGPFHAAFDSDKENVLITFRNFLGKLNITSLKLSQLIPIANRGGSDGEFSKASFGDARGLLCMSNNVCLVADYGSNKVRILDFDKKTVSSICSGNFSSVDGLTINCSLQYPQSLLHRSGVLYIGGLQAIRSIPVLDSCMNNGTTTCNCTDRRAEKTCHNDLDACQDKPCLNSGICMAGVNGTYTCICRDGWAGGNCQTDPDPRLRMRLDISADYMVSCNQLSKYTDITRSSARQRYSQIQELTSRACNQSADDDVVMSCTSDVLKVVWPTDCLFDRRSTNAKEKLLTVVSTNLQKNKVIKLELTMPQRIPPILTPILNEEGLLATVVLTPVCSGGLKYMKATQTCR